MIWLAVFLSDALIGYFSGRYFDARQQKRQHVLVLSVCLDLCIGVNAMGFVTQGWWMLVPSVLGGLVGTYYSLKHTVTP